MGVQRQAQVAMIPQHVQEALLQNAQRMEVRQHPRFQQLENNNQLLRTQVADLQQQQRNQGLRLPPPLGKVHEPNGMPWYPEAADGWTWNSPSDHEKQAIDHRNRAISEGIRRSQQWSRMTGHSFPTRDPNERNDDREYPSRSHTVYHRHNILPPAHILEKKRRFREAHNFVLNGEMPRSRQERQMHESEDAKLARFLESQKTKRNIGMKRAGSTSSVGSDETIERTRREQKLGESGQAEERNEHARPQDTQGTSRAHFRSSNVDEALRAVRSYGPHAPKKEEDRAWKALNMHTFQREMLADRIRIGVQTRVNRDRRPGDVRPETNELNEEEDKLMRRVMNVPTKQEEKEKKHLFAQARHLEQQKTAEQLDRAGVRSFLPADHGPPRVKATPRTNPTPWTDQKRKHFVNSDWKLREAAEISDVREKNGKYPSADPVHYQTAHDFRQRREGRHLARSTSDPLNAVSQHDRGGSTHTVPDESRWINAPGAEEGITNRDERRRLTDYNAQWGRPDRATQRVRYGANLRAHSIGYPGEITHNNDASTHVSVLSESTVEGPTQEPDRDRLSVPAAHGMHSLLPWGQEGRDVFNPAHDDQPGSILRYPGPETPPRSPSREGDGR